MNVRLPLFRRFVVVGILALGVAATATPSPTGASTTTVTVKGYVINFGRYQVGRLVFLRANRGSDADATLGPAQSGTQWGAHSYFRSYTVVLHDVAASGAKVNWVAFQEPAKRAAGQFSGRVGWSGAPTTVTDNLCGNSRSHTCPQHGTG